MITLPIRKRRRIKEYDYTKSGYYYVTICTYNRELLFGEIIVGPRRAVAEKTSGMKVNEYGNIVCEEWENIYKLRKNVELDEYIIMPNHLHGIIVIKEADTARRVPTEKFGKPISGSLSTIMRSFKSSVTKRINEIRNVTITPVWQKSFYDHIIRNKQEMNRIREYIKNNPAHWDKDREFVKIHEKT